jgi:hypothetical protein
MLLVGINVAPVTIWEHFFATFILLLACILFAGVFENMTVLMNEISKKSNKFHDMLDDANNAMTNLNLSSEIIYKVDTYLSYTFINLYKQDELKRFLKLLSPNYRQIFSMHLYRDLLKKNVTLFEGLEKAKNAVVKKLKTTTFIPDEEIFK